MKKIVPALLLLALAVPAHALTFVQMPDQALLDQADVVLEGEILGTVPFVKQPRDYRIYRVAVSEYLKGHGGYEVEVRVPGAAGSAGAGAPDGALVVPGAPALNVGDQVLLFLTPREDGAYTIMQSTLGVFYRKDVPAGNSTAVRRLAGTYELPGTGLGVLLPAADQVRDWSAFKAWLKVTAAGGQSSPSYWNADVPGDDEPTTGNFTTLGTPPSRWFEFDSDQNVTQRAHSSGQVGVPGGGFTEFQAGIAAWNNDTGSNIRYAYGGTTTASGGFQVADGVNTILFNDPNNEIDGSFDCNVGGVLATGGFRTNGTGTFNLLVFGRIIESDIVIQDNTGCFLNGNNRTNAAEIFAHELGHTLGLGHSCGDIGFLDCVPLTPADDALMRAFPHADGRGAELRVDDQLGAAFLYTGATSGGGEPPPEGGGGGGAAADSGGGGGGATDLLFLLLLLLVAIPALHRQRPRAVSIRVRK